MIKRLRLTLKRDIDESYDILIGHGLLDNIPLDLKRSPVGSKYAIVTDSTIKDIYGERLLERFKEENLNAYLIDFPAGEES
ncbi:MAG: 3-dehydroquinate synthase, partial [Candidatus Bathyarchaeia archaeon]